MASASPSPGPIAKSTKSRALSPHDRQRQQLEKLLKDPSKPAYVPPPPKEKSIRPPREMMKNVQGSSAGAGSGEFHVYKASRRREYERLKMMDEISQKEASLAEFEEKKRKWEEEAEARTAKNRAKRQKKKEKGKQKGNGGQETNKDASGVPTDAPLKKRRLISGKEIVFKRPGEGDDDSDYDEDEDQLLKTPEEHPSVPPTEVAIPIDDKPRITIHEDD